MIERLAVSWEDTWFAVIAALAWLSASFVSCPEVGFQYLSGAGVEITAATPSPGPGLVLIEDDDLELQEDDLDLCGLPDTCLLSPPSLSLSQVTPLQSATPSILTAAQYPLRC